MDTARVTVNCRFLIWVAVMPNTVTDLGALGSADLTQLLSFDSQRTLVLTVNNRHARRLLSDLSTRLRDDRRVMPLPAIVPLAAWFRQAADELSFAVDVMTPAHYLDAFAARGLWRQVIEEIEGDDTSGLLDKATAARLALEADTLVDEWELVVDPALETPDYQRFAMWRDSYRERLTELDAEDGNISIGRVCRAAANGALPIDFDILVLAGFNELSPRLQALVAAFGARGVSVLTLSAPRSAAGQKQRVVVADTDTEWWAAARWARDRLQENPQGRFAIVGSRLEADVALVHRVLRQTLPPTEGYNIAVARPLSEWPAVRAALAWLAVLADFKGAGRVSPKVAGAALLAGACAGASVEVAGRAKLDAQWRQKAVSSLSLPAFTQALANFTPQLHQAWVNCAEAFSNGRSRDSLQAWAARFRDYLGHLGFPGTGTPGSTAFQTLEAFDRMLGQLGQYAVVWGQVSFAEAAGLLGRLASETLFQPQRDPFARLDVLGLLEAEGGRWDAVWVLGLTDEVLPAPTRPNPLIPASVLRQAGAPRATPERELHWAGVLFDDLGRLAPNVWFSHARHEGERELRPSPFIAGLAEVSTVSEPLAESAAVSCKLEAIIDQQGPALTASETVSGGIALLDTQSRNPLWAFVKYRLGASQLPDYAPMGNQNARGLFMHRALELIWRKLEHHEALGAASSEGTLSEVIETALSASAAEHLLDYSETLRQLEISRARGVITKWLSLEQDRAPFAIEAVEHTVVWSRDVLKLTLRLDRLDRLADGQLAIIDYKTGNGKPQPKADWLRERPIELQLPFYAAVTEADSASDRVGALVLARLHARECVVKGVAETDLYELPGLEMLPEWSSLLASWRAAINGLADEFIAGDARNVYATLKDLTYCDVMPFLRLNESIAEAMKETGGSDV